jgi:WD40 repeat protein
MFPGALKSYLNICVVERARMLTATSADFYIYFWNLHTGKKFKRFRHENIVTNYLHNRRQTRAVSLCHKGSLRIIDLVTMKSIKYIKDYSISLWISNTFAYNFESNHFFGNEIKKQYAKIENIFRKRLMMKTKLNDQYFENFIYNAKPVEYVTANKTTILIINARSLKIKKIFNEIKKFTGSVYSMGSCRSGRILLVGSSNGSLLGYDTVNHKILFLLKQSGSVFNFKLSSNEKFVISSGEKSVPLKIWDVQKSINDAIKVFKLEEINTKI